MANQAGQRPTPQKTAMAAFIVLFVVTCIMYGASLFNDANNDDITDAPDQADVIEVPPAPPAPPVPPNADVTDEVFVVVENMPELIGGLSTIQKHIKYPEVAKKAGIEGRVFIQFVVDKNGNVQDPKVVRGIGGGCDEEAVRALSMAKFKPGMQRGEIVSVKMSIPVTFKLA